MLLDHFIHYCSCKPRLEDALYRIGHGPDSPPVQLALAGMFVLFVLGAGHQILQLRRQRAMPRLVSWQRDQWLADGWPPAANDHT